MRRKDREVTDREEILKIIEKAKILHLGLMDEEYPYVVPLHYGYEWKDGIWTFYMHGAKEGHKLDLIGKGTKACVELETDVESVSGGEIPCMYGSAFASVIGRGEATLVDDVKEKIKAIKLLMQNQTGRSFEIDEKMADTVAIMKVTVTNLTAKKRMVPPVNSKS